MRKIYPSLSLLVLSAASAFGQCPANPLTALSGTWTFNVHAVGNAVLPRIISFAAAGQFKASLGVDRAGQPIGLLTINATSLIDGSSTRLEGDVGRYQINADCTGGTLTFNLSSNPMQYDFWFYDSGRSIRFVSSNERLGAVGTATQGPLGCPAGLTNPLGLLSGAYAFKIQGLSWFSAPNNNYGRAGRFVASIGTNRAGAPVGQLAITVTSNLPTFFSVTRLERDAGSFQIYDDCSGGTLTMNLSSGPQQYEFYFRAGFQELDVIATTGKTGYGVVNAVGPLACPANPLTLISNAWTFNAQALPSTETQVNTVFGTGDLTTLKAIAGQWRASITNDRAGNPIGTLAINATSLLGLFSSVTRLETDAGRFQIFDDCTGGTLTMNLSSRPMQYDFFFFDGGRTLYFVSTTDGQGAVGTAYSNAPTACPAGLTQPLSLLSGPYVVGLEESPNRLLAGYALAGRMAASLAADRAGNPLGVLDITATSDIPTLHGLFGYSVARLERDAGRFQINDDCTGGTLTFNLSSQPTQHQFYFRSGFTAGDLIMTSDYQRPITLNVAIFGVFNR